MAGFGESEYGNSEYGIGDNTIIITGEIRVYPPIGPVGNSVIVANVSDTGVSFLDPTLDDSFNTGSLNLSLWTPASTGSTTASTGSGLIAELRENGGGSSYGILGTANYVDGNVSVDYQILSQFLANQSANMMTYAKLEMIFGVNSRFSVARVVTPGVNNHQILVDLVINGFHYGGSTLRTNSERGELRLMKAGNVLAAMHDDQVLFESNNLSLANFTVRVSADTNGQSQYIKTKFTNFKSNPGVLFGDTFMTETTFQGPDRLNGIIPASDIVGPVAVTVFNHDGIIGSLNPAFEYPLVVGARLSPNGGVNATIQSDTVLR